MKRQGLNALKGCGKISHNNLFGRNSKKDDSLLKQKTYCLKVRDSYE